MKIALIRHFATKGNLEKRYIGITDEGIDSSSIPDNFTLYPKADIVIASPMRRCIETAALIYKKQPVLCEKFRECDFGLFEHKNYEELKDNILYQQWLASMGTEPFPEGESTEEFKSRCREGFRECVRGLTEENVKQAAMVVHGGTIMAVMEAYGIPKKPFYERQAGNGKGYVLSICEEKWKQGILEAVEERVL